MDELQDKKIDELKYIAKQIYLKTEALNKKIFYLEEIDANIYINNGYYGPKFIDIIDKSNDFDLDHKFMCLRCVDSNTDLIVEKIYFDSREDKEFETAKLLLSKIEKVLSIDSKYLCSKILEKNIEIENYHSNLKKEIIDLEIRERILKQECEILRRSFIIEKTLEFFKEEKILTDKGLERLELIQNNIKFEGFTSRGNPKISYLKVRDSKRSQFYSYYYQLSKERSVASVELDWLIKIYLTLKNNYHIFKSASNGEVVIRIEPNRYYNEENKPTYDYYIRNDSQMKQDINFKLFDQIYSIDGSFDRLDVEIH